MLVRTVDAATVLPTLLPSGRRLELDFLSSRQLRTSPTRVP
jgi:hypothetical protein